MDCALSYCLTMAFSSVMLYRVERLRLYFLWENGYCLCYSCVLTKPCSLKCIMHHFFLFLCVFCHLHFFYLFIYFLCSALENIIIRHILSYRLFLYKAASLYACSSPNNYVTTELFVMVHVCQHFCRALFPIMSISICRITNKCVYNSCVWSLVFSTNELLFVGHICIFCILRIITLCDTNVWVYKCRALIKIDIAFAARRYTK